MRRLAHVLSLVVAMATLWPCAAGAAPRAFAFTWDSNTLSPGQREPQVHLTERLFRSTLEPYAGTDARFLLGLGLIDGLETLLGLDTGIEAWGATGTSVDARLASQWRYRFLAATDVLGLAVVGGVFLGLDALDVEVRLVVEKELGRARLAANAALRRGATWRTVPAPPGKVDQRLEQTLAASFRVNESFSAGVEALAREGFDGATFQGTGFFLGPSFTYTGARWWLSVGLVAQVAAHKARADRGNGEPLEVRSNERFMARVTVGGRD